MTKRNFYLCAFWACLACITVSPLFSQEHLGSIQGIVTDQQGGAVPSATVTVANQATGVVNTTKTDSTGNFGIPFLVPGTYRVSVDAPGFSTSVNQNVVLDAQETRRLDFLLQVGTTKQEVMVTSAAPLLQTDTTALQGSITTSVLLELPLVNQNAASVVMLLPGMSNTNNFYGNQVGGFLAGSGPAGPVSPAANGIRDSAASYTADGANINAGMYNYLSANPAEDAVQEVSIQTGNYSAEYGAYAGVHVNFALKSGTNSFHGSGWEFLERTGLNARNFFSPTVAPLHQDQFGGSVGGPIRKDKTFFFGSYQGFRSSSSSHIDQTVLTTTERTGDLSADVNGNPIPVFNDPTTGQPFPLVNGKPNQIPMNRISPTALAAISILEPTPNSPGPNNWQENLTFPSPYNQETVKIDNVFNQKDTLSGRYWETKSTLYLGGGTAGNIGNNIIPVDTYCFGLTETHTLSPLAVLASRFSFNRNTEAELYNQFKQTIDTRALFSMNIPSSIGPGDIMNTYPLFTVPGYTLMGTTGNIPLASQPDENYEIASTLNLIKGKHSMNIGYEVYRLRSGRLVNDNTNGEMSFAAGNPNGSGNALADFLLGLPDSSTIALAPIVADMRHTMVDLFIADKWRVTSKLTVEAGIRYEMDLPLNEHWGRFPVFNFSPAPGSFTQLAPGEGIWQVSMRNWAPRLGINYQLSSRDVIRSAFGTFYDFPPELEMTFKGANPPYITTYNFQSAPGAPLTSQNAFPIGQALSGGVVSPQAFQTNVKIPRVNQWSFDLQHSFNPNLMLDVGYIGNRAYDFGRSLTLNTPLTPGTPCPIAGPIPGCTPQGDIQERRPLPNWGPVSYYGFSSVSTYEALQVKLEKRFSYGLSLLGSYTWSKTLDMSSDELLGYTYIPTALNSYYGPSDMDEPSNLRLAYVYKLPVGRGQHWAISSRAADLALGGWEITGTTTYHSGFPFDVTYSDSTINNVGLGEFPDRVCNGKLSNRTIQEWFNPACFVSPIPSNLQGVYSYGFFGNSPHGPLRGPHLVDFDLGLMKDFTTYEKQYLQFRIEAYNAFNHANFGQPASTVGPGITNAGLISSAGPARFMSIGFKYYF